MSDIFNAMYDEIFLKDNYVKPLDNERINTVTKKYLESKVSLKDKKDFLRLKKEYLKVINIEDYKDIQDKLYAGKNKVDILSFELARISKQKNLDCEIIENISDVKKILTLYEENIPDELYKKIINGVIKLEMLLGMNVGLFNELCCLFEDDFSRIETEVMSNDLDNCMKK